MPLADFNGNGRKRIPILHIDLDDWGGVDNFLIVAY